jgi:D-amino peptidase
LPGAEAAHSAQITFLMRMEAEMKIYLSCDIEGVTGTAHWDETRRMHQDYPYFAKQMTREVAAACRGALEAGASEIWIKDAHGSGRNLISEDLPRQVRLIRGWSGHPYGMMQEIDHSFQAAGMVGYHSLAGEAGNPLAHTKTLRVRRVLINGMPASEYMFNSYTAFDNQVPVMMISGDEEVCEHAKELNPNITTVGVSRGIGESSISLHPEEAAERIEKAAYEAFKGDLSACLMPLPDKFEMKLTYAHHSDAYRSSFYPGVIQLNQNEVEFKADNYFDILRAAYFLI